MRRIRPRVTTFGVAEFAATVTALTLPVPGSDIAPAPRSSDLLRLVDAKDRPQFMLLSPERTLPRPRSD